MDSQGAHRPPTGMSPPCLIDFRTPTSHFTSVAVRRLGRCVCSRSVLHRSFNTNSNHHVRQPLPVPVRDVLREHPLLARVTEQDDLPPDSRDSIPREPLASCIGQAGELPRAAVRAERTAREARLLGRPATTMGEPRTATRPVSMTRSFLFPSCPDPIALLLLLFIAGSVPGLFLVLWVFGGDCLCACPYVRGFRTGSRTFVDSRPPTHPTTVKKRGALSPRPDYTS